mmetsp:Transcript_50123/g.150879  ORF Transcript_50123/g.150879 Transcript_50123/m.150879 type:complete len:375 (-) Transcript_50123:46-1170(-)
MTALRELSRVISLIGSIAAQRHSSFRSDPEYPSVHFATLGIMFRAFSVIFCFFRNNSNICSRESKFGRPISNVRGNLRRMAESTSYGRLVAPSTMTGRSASRAESVIIPSQSVRNSDFMVDVAEPSDESLWLRKVSISSINTTEGASFRARLKVALTNLLDSPNHLSMMLDRRTFTNVAPLSLAIALANMVFPVPGAPYSSIPRGGVTSPESERNRSGRRSGNTTRSHSSALMPSMPPTSLKAVVISPGSTTSSAMAVSYSFRSSAHVTTLCTCVRFADASSSSRSFSATSRSALSRSSFSRRFRASSFVGRPSLPCWILFASHPLRKYDPATTTPNSRTDTASWRRIRLESPLSSALSALGLEDVPAIVLIQR